MYINNFQLPQQLIRIVLPDADVSSNKPAKIAATAANCTMVTIARRNLFEFFYSNLKYHRRLPKLMDNRR